MNKQKIALVRGSFLNNYEMQFFAPIIRKYYLAGFASLFPIHNNFSFPVINLFSPVDLVKPFENIAIINRFSMGVLNRVFIDAQYLFGLEKALIGFDIAHCAESYYSFTMQCLKAKKKGYVKKVVSTVWENIPGNNEGIWGRKSFKKRAFAEVDHFIAVTRQARQALISDGCNPNKVTVIYPGVDCLRFKFKRNQKNKAKNILFVGRLEIEKGVWEILNAFKHNFLKNNNIRLHFCGRGSQEKLLVSSVKENRLSNVIRISNVSYGKMPSIYKWADIIIMFSKETKYWKEQFGMVLIEAMASGVPIIAARTGAIPEIIGDAGILIKDELSLKVELESIICDYRKREYLAKLGRERVMRLFEAKQTSKSILNCYKKLLSDS